MKRNFIKMRNRIMITLAGVCLAVGTVCFATAIFGLNNERLVERNPVPAMKRGVDSASSFYAATSKSQFVSKVSSMPSAVSDMSSATSAVSSTPEAIPETPRNPSGRTAYLTFDDGPSSLTAPLLDLLDKYRVKATFFVVGTNDRDETAHLQEIVRRGHAIGVHSYTHNYRQIYASADAFFADFDKMHGLIQQATGVNTKICRFPGGSVNGYNKATRKAILSELKKRGYVYYDWNVSSGDAERKTSPRMISQNTIQGVMSHRTSIVLFHNTSLKGETLRQLPGILAALQKEGCTFSALTPSVDNRSFIF